MVCSLSLAKQIGLIEQIIDRASEKNDERLLLEASKVLERLVNTESKMQTRNAEFLHRSQVAVLGQVVISIIARHLQGIPDYGETLDAIGNELGERLAIEMEGQ